MKNSFKLAIVTLVIAVSAAACGGEAKKDGTDTTNTVDSTTTKTTIVADSASKDTVVKTDTTKVDTAKK
jgi:ABC-type glycerol-3-phosphate transport system substrate-binding protein